MEVARKITLASIQSASGGFKIEENEAPRFIGRFMGIARKVETKNSNFGDYLLFTGEFRAVNGEGVISAAPKMILPAPADSLLADSMTKNDGAEVQFAFDVYLAPHPKKTQTDRGYKFKIQPVLEAAPSEPLAALVAALPAPPVAPKQQALPGTDAAAAAPAAAPAAEQAATGKGKK